MADFQIASAARTAKLDEVMRHLPNTYQDRPRLRNDITQLMQNVPSLTPEHGTFSGGGRTVTLFYLAGVLPISYGGSTYNIPVTIYFDPPYPRQAPRCFVTPTTGMALKSGHPNVDQGGMIYMPYLSTWSTNGQSTLAELMTVIASAFSAQPPVYSTAAAAQPAQPQAIPNRPQASQGYPVAVAKAVAVPAVATATAVPVAGRPAPTRQEQAVTSLTREAQARWARALEPIISDINAQNKRKVELQTQVDKVDAEVTRLEATARESQAKESELRGIEEQLQTFVEAHAGKEPDPDKLKDDVDQDSRLVLELLSEEQALEEFLVALDDLLEARKISMDDFLREVRDASREQFKLRVQRQKAANTVRQAAAAAGVPVPAVAVAAAASAVCSCGNPLLPDASFCRHCGARRVDPASAPPVQQAVAAPVAVAQPARPQRVAMAG